MPTNTTRKSNLSWLAALALATVLQSGLLQASEQHFEPAHNDVSNIASLQRGARNFVNYCYGCHSARYVRFSSLMKGLQLTEAQLTQNLMFTGTRISDMMENSLAADDANHWFNVRPPDLSLIARSRGTAYLAAFLKSFYLDPNRPTGVNNTVLPGVAMPHVLWELQGYQTALYEGESTATGDVKKKFKDFELTTAGKLSAEEYDQFVRDTVNFLDYIGEPMQLQRQALGIRVLGFLLVFFLFAYLLKREYWKDVH